MSEKDRTVLAEVQRLPLTESPFNVIAGRLAISEEEVLSICRKLVGTGAIRRFGPSINHRMLGFDSNPMTVLKVPEEQLDEVGGIIAAQTGVTHCYSRSGWDYNLFFMVHAKSREEGESKVHAILDKAGEFEHRVLFSLQEFKKTSFELPPVSGTGVGE